MKLFDIHKFLKSFLSAGFFVTVDTVDDNLDGTYNLNISSSPLYITEGKRWTVNGSKYFIVSVSDTVIVLKRIDGTTDPIVGEVEIYPVFYKHGTVTQTNTEIANLQTFEKTPLMYLIEPFREEYPNSESSAVYYKASPRLFLLDESEQALTTDAVKDKQIKAMRALFEAYATLLEEDSQVLTFEKIDIIDRTRFAKYDRDKGYTESKFNDKLAGIEVSFELTLRELCC